MLFVKEGLFFIYRIKGKGFFMFFFFKKFYFFFIIEVFSFVKIFSFKKSVFIKLVNIWVVEKVEEKSFGSLYVM